MLTDKSFFARSASLLNLSSDVNIFEEVDWTTNHVLFQRRLANRDMWVDSRLSEMKSHDKMFQRLSSKTDIHCMLVQIINNQHDANREREN